MAKKPRTKIQKVVQAIVDVISPPAPAPSPEPALPWWWETPDNPIPNDPDNVRFIERKKWRDAEQERERFAREGPPPKGRPDRP